MVGSCRANIVVPPRSTTPPYEAMKIGEARREELEAEKGEIVKMPFGVRCTAERAVLTHHILETVFHGTCNLNIKDPRFFSFFSLSQNLFTNLGWTAD